MSELERTVGSTGGSTFLVELDASALAASIIDQHPDLRTRSAFDRFNGCAITSDGTVLCLRTFSGELLAVSLAEMTVRPVVKIGYKSGKFADLTRLRIGDGEEIADIVVKSTRYEGIYARACGDSFDPLRRPADHDAIRAYSDKIADHFKEMKIVQHSVGQSERWAAFTVWTGQKTNHLDAVESSFGHEGASVPENYRTIVLDLTTRKGYQLEFGRSFRFSNDEGYLVTEAEYQGQRGLFRSNESRPRVVALRDDGAYAVDTSFTQGHRLIVHELQAGLPPLVVCDNSTLVELPTEPGMISQMSPAFSF